MSEIQTVIMGFTALCLGSSLEETIVELAKFHQGESLAWLDQMEESFISNVKNSHSEGLAHDVELKAMEGAMATIKRCTNKARQRLSGPEAKT
jgi:hypothetical protein